MNLFKLFIFINGIYDLLCAFAILFFPNTIIGNIHPLIFNKDCQLKNRILAYWLITYGSIRCFIIYENKNINLLIALSYFIEAYAYIYEYIYYKTTIKYKVIWISLSSLIIGTIILLANSSNI